MKDYQEQALRTEAMPTAAITTKLDFCKRDIHTLFGLTTEVGELVDAYKRHIFYGQPLDLKNIEEEVGDILWYLAIMLDVCGCSFDDCMRRNIAKLRVRYPEKFDAEKAEHRDLEGERKALSGREMAEAIAEVKEVRERREQEALEQEGKHLVEKFGIGNLTRDEMRAIRTQIC